MNGFALRFDWRVMIVGLALGVTILVLVLTVAGWNRAPTDDQPGGITTGISPANTVYPERHR